MALASACLFTSSNGKDQTKFGVGYSWADFKSNNSTF